MQFTREELEDIWENKPYGYFSKMVKDIKGKKKFIVTTEARKSEVVDTEVQTVWAKDAHQAQNIAHGTNCAKIRVRLDADWNTAISYSTRAMEAKR